MYRGSFGSRALRIVDQKTAAAQCTRQLAKRASVVKPPLDQPGGARLFFRSNFCNLYTYDTYTLFTYIHANTRILTNIQENFGFSVTFCREKVSSIFVSSRVMCAK